ncbi:hypothetical protein EZS27_015423 [termite gut metagenome]|uniref:Uncharacterized protein n=1 Tax=termite gut metagenome TaxID=433724 RepID=A0A5J4RTX6_9ZZZZ
MIRKNSILNLLILDLLLLLVGCNSDSEKEENLTPSISLRFTTDARNGEINPLPEKVNARLHFFGKENEGVIEKEIFIDNNGQGSIEYLTEGKWHISYWNIPSEGQLHFDKNDNSINVSQTGNYLHEATPFYAGVSDFNHVPNNPIYLRLKPQTGVLTILLILDDVTNSPETISGVLSGIVSKRVFEAQGMNISEQGVGYVPFLFTLNSYSPFTYVASYRILGISNTRKCELELVFPNSNSFPVKIDLTTKLETFNNLTTDNTLCIVHIYNDKSIEVTIKVIDWEERDYELDI